MSKKKGYVIDEHLEMRFMALKEIRAKIFFSIQLKYSPKNRKLKRGT